MSVLRNLRLLSLFLEVAEARSFSRAAKRLSISQPAVSRQIKALERGAGAALFDRGQRPLTLTEAGHALVAHAKQVRQAVEALEEGMNASSGAIAGHLKLGASTVWEYMLPAFMGAFQRQHPNAALSLQVGNTEQVIRLLVEGQAHLAFVGDEPKAQDLETIPIADDEIVVVASPGHPLGGRRVPPSRLDGARFVLREPDAATAQISLRYLKGLGVTPVTVMEVGSNESMKAGVRSGFGLAMISKYAIQEELAAGSLVQVRLDAPPCTRRLYAVRSSARLFSRTQQAFLAHVLAQFQPSARRSVGPASHPELALSLQERDPG